MTSDPGLAFDVVTAEAQDDKVNVTETSDQEPISDHANVTHQHDETDETVKEHEKSEPKLLKVRATVEEEQKQQNETVAKDEVTDRHPKELKSHKEDKPEISATAGTDQAKTP